MGKFALLIGVSESSEEGLPALPSATEDVRAMQAVLQNPNLGDFDNVKVLENPTRQIMEEEIETLFANCKKEDLALFYFSGHGITDEKGKLYLVTPQTRKERDNLIKATAVAATVLHDNMDNSRSKYQVLILDSCFSGAIAEGLTAKSVKSKVDIQRELGGEGRAILTSSSAVQKSFYVHDYKLSIYTHYLIDGIQTGAANQGEDDYISVDELHEYAKMKLEQEAPSMSPQFFPVKEGYKIRLVRSPQSKGDPELKYRKEAERLATSEGFTIPAKRMLMVLRFELGISEARAEVIEAEVLRSHQEYRRKLEEYYNVLRECLEEEKILSSRVVEHLRSLRKRLKLREEDVAPIERNLLRGYSLEEFVIEQDRSNFNLSKPLPLTSKEMSEGLAKDILLDDGKRITVKVPAGVKNGQKLRIKGKGKISPNTQNRGDLYLVIQLEDDLSSERFGANYYAKLRDLLASKNWKAADQETSDRVCEVIIRQPKNWFDGDDIKAFPCQDLRNIDHLWMKYSQGKFGFSVQKEIWQRCGSPTKYNRDWEKFGRIVGWQTKGIFGSGIGGGWIGIGNLKYDLETAPEGHLPAMGLFARYQGGALMAEANLWMTAFCRD
jgi:hypothetical protein